MNKVLPAVLSLVFAFCLAATQEVSAQTADTTPPVITNTTNSSFPAGTRQATLSVTTDENATCRYSSVSPLSYGGHVGVLSATAAKTHSVTLGSTTDATVGALSDGTTYTFYVMCKDAAGNTNSSEFPITFTVVGTQGTTVGQLELTSTYESISVYAKYTNDSNKDNSATFKWRKVGDSTWKNGMDMTVDRRPTLLSSEVDMINRYKNQWVASILGVSPDTDYEVEVTFTDPNGVTGTNPLKTQIKTRSNNYPSTGRTFNVSPTGTATTCTDGATFSSIQAAVNCTQAGDTVLVKKGTYDVPTAIKFPNSGTANNYIFVKAEFPATDGKGTVINQGNHSIIDATNADPATCGTGSDQTPVAKCGFFVQKSYVRISGFEIQNVRIGIKVGIPSKNVVIENNFIHDVTFLQRHSVPILVGNTFSGKSEVEFVTVQGNRVVAAPGDPAGHAISFSGTAGGHVVRNNYVDFGSWDGTPGVHGSDCIGADPNDSIWGWGPDNDVYNNICNGATDEGVEVDGSGMNLRVWNNKIFRVNVGISVAPIIVGPAYVFRNSFYDFDLHWTQFCGGVKTGEGGTGNGYFYHNTFYLPDSANYFPTPTSCGGKTTGVVSAGGGIDSLNLVFKNNIFNGWDFSAKPGEKSPVEVKPTLNYNLHFRDSNASQNILQYAGVNYTSFSTFQNATGQELNGLYAQPIFTNKDNLGVSKTLTLESNSPGVNTGVVLAGFNDANSAWPAVGIPDIGAFEFGSSVGASNTLKGDLNNDGRVDLFDYNVLSGDYGKTDTTSLRSDLNSDGMVDLFDYNVFQSNYGK